MRVTGSCTNCGDCCRPPIMACPWMSNAELTACSYLTGPDGDGKYSCQIKDGTASKVPEIQKQYYIEECEPYPAVERHPLLNEQLSPNCGYSFKE